MSEKNNLNVSMPSVEQVETELKRIDYRRKYKKVMFSTLSVLVVVAAVAVLICTLFMPVVQVSGDSMEPSLSDGEILLTIKSKKVERGDLCCISWQNKLLLKRVIGLPGDTIDMDDEGNVYVNGAFLDEPYLSEKSSGVSEIEFPFEVPEERYFILGDKRDLSVDSRNASIGCVEHEQIVGQVLFRVWPLFD